MERHIWPGGPESSTPAGQWIATFLAELMIDPLGQYSLPLFHFQGLGFIRGPSYPVGEFADQLLPSAGPHRYVNYLRSQGLDLPGGRRAHGPIHRLGTQLGG